MTDKENTSIRTKITSFLFYFSIIAIIVLTYTGQLKPVIEFLSSKDFQFDVGEATITPYLILKSLFAIIVVFWVAGKIISLVRKSVSKLTNFGPSNRSLLIKSATIIIYSAAFLVILNIIGIDLTALAVFSGALGIGLGFGLQKITSNFISGIIMLFERSVEQGDVVELESGVYGYIRSVNARYTLVETYDGKEIMIPNEEFIVDRVTNWTYSNSRGRLALNIGVSYNADLHKVKKIILDAASNHDLCSKDEEPQCHLLEFADSSVNFRVFVWVEDFSQGRYHIQNDILFKIWDEFKANDIEIPFPQRDLHIKNPEKLAESFGSSVNEGESKNTDEKNSSTQERKVKKRVSARFSSVKRDKKKLH